MNKLDLTQASERLIPKMLDRQAEKSGDQEWLITDEQSLTFADAQRQSDRLASGLQALGVVAGDRVALLLSNRVEMVLLSFAVNKLGAIWTPVNTDYKGEWLADTIARSRSKVFVTETAFLERVLSVRDALSGSQLVLVADEPCDEGVIASDYDALLQYAPIDPDYGSMDYGDSNAILWTSGTTGKSKGVLQSHNAWLRSVQSSSSQFQSQPGDRIYSPLPLYNTAAWITAIYRSLYEGLPVIVERKFSVSHFMERVNHFGATQTFVIGAMGVFLWNTAEQENDASNPLRVAGITPMPPDIWEPFEQRFGLRILRSGFGMSEAISVANQMLCPPETPKHAMGLPNDELEIKLFDDDGMEVAPGNPGEMGVRPLAPHVLFNGYYDNPEATAAAFRDGWFLTGDLVRYDPEVNAYFFVDRKKDSVRFAGRNISSLEVETVVRKHPDIADVAAYGIPLAEMDSEDELKLSVVLNHAAELSPEDLCQFINDNAPHFFVPRYIEFTSELPCTPTNKVQKFKLRDAGVTENTWDLKKSSYKVQR